MTSVTRRISELPMHSNMMSHTLP